MKLRQNRARRLKLNPFNYEKTINHYGLFTKVNSLVFVHEQDRGVVLYCPDAPMVQVGDFNFGRNQASIPKKERPVLLAWPLSNYW